MDIAPEGRHLTLLQAADLPLGIEHHDIDARHVVEPVRHGAARVARGGREDHQPFVGGSQQPDRAAHEPGAEILEGAGWAVEQLQRIASAPHRPQGHGKVIQLLQLPPQELRIEIVAEEKSGQIARHRGVGLPRQPFDLGHVGLRNAFGNEQPAVGRQPHHRGLAQ